MLLGPSYMASYYDLLQDFTTTLSRDVEFILSPPAMGQVFRFQIHDGVRNRVNFDFCWNVILFGCLGEKTLRTSPIYSSSSY